MKKKLAAFVLCGLMSVLGGCSSLVKTVLKEPKVALQSVAVADVRSDGASILFGVEVENPNAVDIKVDALRYEVEIAGKAFTTGKLVNPAQVPAHGKSVVEIPISLKYSDVFSSLLGFLQTGVSTYRVKGEAEFALFTIPFDRSGEINLKEKFSGAK
jgi:LEA14-like dessication related protein